MADEKIPDTLRELKVPIDGLTPYKDNPRRGNVEVIAESLEINGQFRPIVVRAGTNEILAGNHTYAAARSLGWETIAATFVEANDDQAARIVLVDNRSNDLADYDNAELLELLESLGDELAGTGFEPDDLADLAEGNEQPEETPEDIDEVDDPPTAPIARAGDFFQLGAHRVYCADATRPESYEQLLNGDKPDGIWTDPPYGVSYTGKTKKALTIQNDGGDDLEALLTDAFAAMFPPCRPGAAVYIAHSDTRRITFETTAADAGMVVRQNLIWVKNTMVLGHSDYHYRHEPILHGELPPETDGGTEPEDDTEPAEHTTGRTHEPILYGFTPGGHGRLGRGGPRWHGDNSQTTVFDVPKPPASREHPTMKPVDLIRPALRNSIAPGGLVLDPFGGSGSTLIAAELDGRRAALLELDPRFVDVICRRWQTLTGNRPTRDGQPVDFLTDDE